MTRARGPTARPSRIVVTAAFLAVLAVGVGLGVVLDRYWLRPSAAKPAQDSRLLGRWVRDDKLPVEFKSDGTFESRTVTTFDMPLFGARPDGNKTEKRTRADEVTGQYRWVDGETIELTEPDFGGAWITRRVVFEGDRMTFLGPTGSVERYTRVP